MALEDRDWYRDEPSKEWKRLRRSSTPAFNTTTQDGMVRRTATVWARRIVIAAAVVALAYGVMEYRGPLADALDSFISRDVASRTTAAPPGVLPLPQAVESNVVHLRSRPGLDVPAKVVTRWWLTDPRFGRVEVYVPVGTTPRKALTVALAERGYQVVR